jgi:hypothetical protein
VTDFPRSEYPAPAAAPLSSATTDAPHDKLAPTLPRLPSLPNLPDVKKPSGGNTIAIRAMSKDYHLPWRAIVTNALIIWAVTRVGYVLVTFLAHSLPLPPNANPSEPGFFGSWANWDTRWYLNIAAQGYTIPQDLAFFPLYPGLIRAFMLVTGGNVLIAGLLVANLGTLAALIGLGALVLWETRDQDNLAPAFLLALASPFAFYFAAAYTEGLYCAITIFCLFFARRGQWGWAALFALLSSVARPTGVVLIPALAWEWLRQNGLTDLGFWRARWREPQAALGVVWRQLWAGLRAQWAGLLSLVAAPVGYAGFILYVGIRFHQPTLVFSVHGSYWGIGVAPPWTTASRIITEFLQSPFAAHSRVDTLSFLGVVALVIFCWRKQAGTYNIYMLGLLYLSIAEPQATGAIVLHSTGRYLLPSIPLFITLSPYVRKRPTLVYGLVIVSVLVQAFVAFSFLTGVLVE